MQRRGVTFSTSDGWTTQTRLTAAPAGAGSFDSDLPMDQSFGRLTVGAELMDLGSGLHLRAEYDGAFSDNTTRHGGTLRFAYDF